VARRVATYWRPYHVALASELVRLHGLHGRVMLLDGHSIQGELPWLFEGRLPDLNLGTVDGASCAPALRDRLTGVLERHTAHGHVVDGRFKGGHITRHYGRPADGVHAVQMEMVFDCYMTPPHEYDEARAAAVLPVLRSLAETLIGWQP
jgi:N-formylglutamate deformylase